MARALGVASTGPGGLLLIGASPVGRAIGRALQARGLTVLMWTAHGEYARAAEADGLTLYKGDPSRDATETAPSDLDGLDYALAVGDDEVFNAMIASDVSKYFNSRHVFQLAASGDAFHLPASQRRAAAFLDRVPILFDRSATYEELLTRIEAGAEITVIDAPAAGKNGEDTGTDRAAALPMFVYTPGKDLRVLLGKSQVSRPGRS